MVGNRTIVFAVFRLVFVYDCACFRKKEHYSDFVDHGGAHTLPGCNCRLFNPNIDTIIVHW